MVCGVGAGWKCAGAGSERAKFLKFLRVWGRAGLNFAGVGRERTKNFNPLTTLVVNSLRHIANKALRCVSNQVIRMRGSPQYFHMQAHSSFITHTLISVSIVVVYQAQR